MDTLYLVACVKLKEDHPCPARTLYKSPWFKKARAYVLKQGHPWAILSAKHGLLDPDTEIAPYDKTLYKMPAKERRAWGEWVSKELRTRFPKVTKLVILAGAVYRTHIDVDGYKVEIPMEGLEIGDQLNWLDNH